MVGDVLLWDLRRQKNLVIPDSAQRIEKQWFKNCEIESVTIPASVTVIEEEAFCDCKQLKRVTFAEDSPLKKIAKFCFGQSGLGEITIPDRITAIEDDAFYKCKSFK